MKKFLGYAILSLALVLALAVVPAWAEPLTPQVVVDHVDKAVKLIEEQGEAAAFPLLTDPSGEWVKGELYVFVYDLSGNIVAHLNKKLEGKNLLKVKDVKGNVFAADFIAIAKGSAGEGWCEYYWPKPNEKEASLKTSYIKKVPGKELLVGVGTYDFPLDQARKETGKP
ncbi:MAG: cache domain-containing protein [Pseudomonadota bacterium]